MSNTPLPNELREFLARYVRSVEQLEILCRLSENPDRCWSAAEMYQEIQSSPLSVETNLQHFVDEGFSIQDSKKKHQFSPATSEIARIAHTLVTTYRQRPVAVIGMLYSMPSDAVRQFSNAFKLRKQKP